VLCFCLLLCTVRDAHTLSFHCPALQTVPLTVARFQPFKLRVLERPMQADAVRADLEAELAAELALRPQARPAPPPATAEVRGTQWLAASLNYVI
jgi:hypothetical protein